MGKVIKYDKPVRNLIDALTKTGHVTRREYKKDCVTFHHNAGTGGHDRVLKTWQSRPASAHFNVDKQGTVAQFVELNHYAWATGNREGNQRSVSIEMTNVKTSPTWEVAEETWGEACRLAAWIHWKAFGFRPTKESIRFHSDWKATACPGPHMQNLRNEVLELTQVYYDEFVAPPKPEPEPETPERNLHLRSTVKKYQSLLDTIADGKWGPNTDRQAREMRRAAWSYAGWPNNRTHEVDIRRVQKIIGTDVDGIWGPKSQAALEDWVKKYQELVGTAADGKWGPKTDGRFINTRRRYLNKY